MTHVAHFPLGRLADDLRAAGLVVEVLDGAQGRSARLFASVGYGPAGCQAHCVHHTGSSGLYPAYDIQYILNGQGEGFVVSNSYVARDGKVTLIASGPTYTEGLGGPLGIIPKDKGNNVCFSTELGGGGKPWPRAQQDAAVILSVCVGRIAADVWGWPDDPFSRNRLFGHFEWTSRKVDPSGISDWATSNVSWDMNGYRADVAAAATPEGDTDMIDFPVPPRIYDSRPGSGRPGAGSPPLQPGESRRIVMPFDGKLSDGRRVVAGEFNVTAITLGVADGWLAVSPADALTLEHSDLNWNTGERVRNMQLRCAVDANGIRVHNGPTRVEHLIVDWKAYQAG